MTIKSVALIFSAGLVLGAAIPANAKVKPGQYDMGGIQQICLVNDGTWYGTTYSAWGGLWLLKPADGLDADIFGNFSSGFGNDQMSVHRGGVKWTEWEDDLSFYILNVTSFTFVKKDCDPPPAKSKGEHRRPAE